MNHSTELATLKKRFHKEEGNALRFRKAGDLLNYIRRLREARKLREAYNALSKHKEGRKVSLEAAMVFVD